jgi:pimeloyl-ACP methyl ester carboxylesterase
VAYDELSLLRENAEELGIPWRGPRVERRFVAAPDGRRVSALVWGEAPARVVLLHGGAQNAHTWDSVALALDLPLVAIDLPGHGHSEWRADHVYHPSTLAADVAPAVEALAPAAELVCGMSLGGLTAIALAARRPELVRRLAVVDVTPGTDHAKAEPIVAFVSGPETFESFDAILERTVRFHPTRSLASLRRGVLHNARELPDGRYSWRYDPVRRWRAGGGAPDFASLWSEVSALRVPVLLVRGALSGVVGDEDVAEFRRRQPGLRVATVEGAGHSVQGDRPLALAALLRELLSAPPPAPRP